MLTNKLNLPEPFLRAAENGSYSKGLARYSVTELIDPPRYGALRRLYKDVIVEDVADQVEALMGTMFHQMLEKAGAPTTQAILEERIYAQYNGVTISGAMDHTILWDNGCLDDYKATKVYAVRSATRFGKPEWTAQLNVYRLLRALSGQTIEKLRIIAWMKDWSIVLATASAQKEDGDYPAHAILPIDIEVWPLEQTVDYVKERIRLHLEADEWLSYIGIDVDEAPCREPFCTDEERWRNPVRWALMKEGRKTAVKLYDTEVEANYAVSQTKGGYTELRGGECKRCVLYCAAGRAGLCTQWEAEKAILPDKGAALDTSAFD